ncbi:methyltransferase [Streptomyces sp. IMTB 2501]|uniref:FkbM family methyltransferase n=1 Tax=Streptomyces sp. IMTB 2501 TaxID=1776340 RepID=UPI00096BD3EA|nr:FkbM family methyltransferase [Streptomyces sp. IMTB 2501]OLZ74131.1 methyltransferase [Streptomyces sp. IMTB 2501]
MNEIADSARHKQLAEVLREHPAVADALVTGDTGGDGHARIVPDPAAAAVLHRSVALEEAGRLGAALGWHEPAGQVRVAGLNRSETEFLHREIFTDNAYFRHGITLPAGAVVLDVGANIGMFTLCVARRSPGARIIAVEPVAELADAVAVNAELHQVDATVLRTALGRAEGLAEFTFYPHNSVMSGRFADTAEDLEVLKGYLLTGENAQQGEHLDRLAADRMTAQTRQVPVTTLTAVVHEHGLARIDLLKIDVEKAEAEVLDGIDDELWPRIDRIVLEVHDVDGRLAAVLAELRGRGFDVTHEQDARLALTPCHNIYARRPRADTAPTTPTAPVGGLTQRRLEEELRDLVARRLPSVPGPGHYTLTTDLTTHTDDHGPARERTVPASPRIAVLARIWAELFGPEAVRPDADFFDLGGDSLTAVRLMATLESELGEDALTPDLIFTDSTFGALAAAVEASGDPERTART